MTLGREVFTNFAIGYRAIGRTAAVSVFVLGVAYALVTTLGFLSLASPQEPIGYPYVTLMELLIFPLAVAYLITMAAIHVFARPASRVYSLTALVFMTIVAAITTSVHFLVLTVGPQIDSTVEPWAQYVFSFTWPSVLHALDILAWDWFFALSLLFASFVFTDGKLQRAVRVLLLVSAVLSLAGLLGVPLADMRVRNIGIIGYAVVSPIAFLLIALVFGRDRTTASNTAEEHQDTQTVV